MVSLPASPLMVSPLLVPTSRSLRGVPMMFSAMSVTAIASAFVASTGPPTVGSLTLTLTLRNGLVSKSSLAPAFSHSVLPMSLNRLASSARQRQIVGAAVDVGDGDVGDLDGEGGRGVLGERPVHIAQHHRARLVVDRRDVDGQRVRRLVEIDAAGRGAAIVLDLEAELRIGGAIGVERGLEGELAGIDVGDADGLSGRHRDAVVAQRSGERQRGDPDGGERVAVGGIGEPEVGRRQHAGGVFERGDGARRAGRLVVDRVDVKVTWPVSVLGSATPLVVPLSVVT